MISPRWRKVLSDARTARGRFIGMIIAMSISIAAIVAILSSHAVLKRELQTNFSATLPASAVLRVEGIDDQLLQQVRARPGITAAERRGAVIAKIEAKPGEWLPITLFIAQDFANLSTSKFYPHTGEWPPKTGSILIERSAEPLMDLSLGRRVVVEMPKGQRQTLRLSGLTHDPGQAPSWQEIAAYGYITPETLAMLDATQSLNLLEIVVASKDNTIERIDAIARELGVWLGQQGQRVQLIRIPKPGAHPHQWQIDLVVAFLFGFSFLALVLEAVLLSIVVAGMLAPQIRQIGVMKAVGARTHQIAGMYLGLIAAVAATALLFAFPIGLVAANMLWDFIARMLNFEIANESVPWPTLTLCIALGMLVPLVAALWPTWSAARRSVRDAIDDHGVGKSTSQGSAARALMRVRLASPSLQLALRNFLRRKSRFALTISLLTLAGIVFILAGNLKAVWENVAVESAANRLFDLQVNLRQDASESKVLDIVRAVAGVRIVEPSKAVGALIDSGDGLPVLRADQNNFVLRSLQTPTELLTFAMSEGRWLLADDYDAVVINNTARAQAFPNAKLGDVISLLVNRRSVRLRLVGVAREVFGSATGYTTPNVLDDALDAKGLTRAVGVALQPGHSIRQAAEQIKQTLEREKIEVRSIATNESINRNVSAHTYMLIAVLGIIVASVALVGAIGLASALSTSVLERTREFGILRTIGASSRAVRNTVLGEALLVGIVSWLLALLMSVPLWMVVMRVVNSLSPISLTSVWSISAVVGWLALVLVACAVASIAPAARAARLTIRQTLAYT